MLRVWSLENWMSFISSPPFSYPKFMVLHIQFHCLNAYQMWLSKRWYHWYLFWFTAIFSDLWMLIPWNMAILSQPKHPSSLVPVMLGFILRESGIFHRRVSKRYERVGIDPHWSPYLWYPKWTSDASPRFWFHGTRRFLPRRPCTPPGLYKLRSTDAPWRMISSGSRWAIKMSHLGKAIRFTIGEILHPIFIYFLWDSNHINHQHIVFFVVYDGLWHCFFRLKNQIL